jgi:YD repeat-containing protein
MKHITILSVAIFLLAAAGCKKNKTEPPPPTGTPKIKTETYNGSSTTSYEYDTQGRRTLVTNSNGSKTVYNYSGNTVSEKNYDNAGIFINESDHELNASGFVQKTTYGASISRTTYQYNANNQLVNIHYVIGPLSDSADFRYFYSLQGRLDSTWYFNINSPTFIYKAYYEYTISKPNTIFLINKGILFFGTERSINPPSKITVVYPSVNPRADTYTYEYDTYNRITKEIYNGTDQTTFIYY